MPRLSMKLAVGIAVILSIVVAGMVYAYLRDVATAKQKDLRPVVVVAQNVAPKTILTKEMLKQENVPSIYVQPGAIDKINTAVGVMVKEQLMAGEQVVKHRLLLDTKGDGLAFQLPPGMRAYTVGVNETSGGAGFIRPGDKVDVLATYDKSITGEYTSHLVLQDITVLALNRSDVQPAPVAAGDAKGPAKSSAATDNKLTSVTLAITPEDAAKMALAEDRGRIRLALRPFATEAMPIMPVRAMTPRDLVGYLYRAPQSSTPPVSAVNYMPMEYRMSAPVSAPVVSSGNSVEVVRGTSIEKVAVK